MTTTTALPTRQFLDDPLVSGSSRLTLARPDEPAAQQQAEQQPQVSVVPWNLRRLGPPLTSSGRWASVSFDPQQQVMVDASGQAVVGKEETLGTNGVFVPVAGDPSADTTPIVDGEDPPSSEDWDNDYAPEGPDPV